MRNGVSSVVVCYLLNIFLSYDISYDKNVLFKIVRIFSKSETLSNE